MKKFLTLIIILLIPLILCSCEKRTFGLIEVNSSAITGYLLETENLNIIMAIYNEQDSNTPEFLNNLEKISKEINQNIYIINAEHIDQNSSMLFIDGFELEYDKLIYVAYENGQEKVYNYFGNYENMYEDLKECKSVYDLNLDNYKVLDEDKYIKDAKDDYKNGYISSAYERLNMIWPSKAAKKEYENNKLYYLIKSWSMYSATKSDNIVVNSFLFTTGSNIVYIAEKEGKDGSTPSLTMADYSMYYYYIKDDIIYISKDKNGEYKKGYTIENIEKSKLTLKDNKKTYNLTPQI